MENLFAQKVINTNNVFGRRFLDNKVLYLYYFNVLPSLSFISQVDGEKIFEALKEQYGGTIKHIHQYRWFERKRKKFQFDKTIVVAGR